MNILLNIIVENIVPLSIAIALSIFIVKSIQFDGTRNNPHVDAK